jgi:uncharacterized repeat protein (TIGR03837 family)
VPEGVATAALDTFLRGDLPRTGETRQRGSLLLAAVPFIAQDEYDRRLWSCDLNFVRGEDSFVRAQWAARPFVWNIYPQDALAHRAKLDAFLGRYCAGLPAPLATAVRGFWQAFDAGDGTATAVAWPALRAALPALADHGRRWAEA